MELSKIVWSLVTNLPVFRPLLISRCSRKDVLKENIEVILLRVIAQNLADVKSYVLQKHNDDVLTFFLPPSTENRSINQAYKQLETI